MRPCSNRIRSGAPGVADRTTHEQTTDHVEEWQSASLGFRTHHGNDLLDAFRSLAFIRAQCVHLGCFRSALAGRRRLDAEAFQEL